MPNRLICCSFALLLLLPAPRVAAQDTGLRPDTAGLALDTMPAEAPVPRTMFIRSLLVPGWGHFSMGESRRGAVYLALQSTSWAMLLKTASRLSDARAAERVLDRLGRDSLAAAMAADTALARQLQNPVQYEDALSTYPGLTGARSLTESRERHRQDWMVYTMVFTFAGAVDAYVSAHLLDFPVEITAAPARDGGTTFGLRLPVGTRR